MYTYVWAEVFAPLTRSGSKQHGIYLAVGCAILFFRVGGGHFEKHLRLVGAGVAAGPGGGRGRVSGLAGCQVVGGLQFSGSSASLLKVDLAYVRAMLG